MLQQKFLNHENMKNIASQNIFGAMQLSKETNLSDFKRIIYII